MIWTFRIPILSLQPSSGFHNIQPEKESRGLPPKYLQPHQTAIIQHRRQGTHSAQCLPLNTSVLGKADLGAFDDKMIKQGVCPPHLWTTKGYQGPLPWMYHILSCCNHPKPSSNVRYNAQNHYPASNISLLSPNEITCSPDQLVDSYEGPEHLFFFFFPLDNTFG